MAYWVTLLPPISRVGGFTSVPGSRFFSSFSLVELGSLNCPYMFVGASVCPARGWHRVYWVPWPGLPSMGSRLTTTLHFISSLTRLMDVLIKLRISAGSEIEIFLGLEPRSIAPISNTSSLLLYCSLTICGLSMLQNLLAPTYTFVPVPHSDTKIQTPLSVSWCII